MKNKNTKIVAVICVRMSSSRLPGKVMMPIMGKPVLGYLIERIKMSDFIDQTVVATSINSENDVIQTYCEKTGIPCFRGSEDDVLGRMLGALKVHRADMGVEIFGDGPLVDPKIIDNIIRFYIDNIDKYDFVSNDLKTTFPPGTEVEVFSVRALDDSAKKTVAPGIREHGTLYIRQHPEIYRLYNIEAPPDLRYPGLGVELDTWEDFMVIKSILEELYPGNSAFTIYDVINFLRKRPELIGLNKNIPRRWKQFRENEI